MILGSTLPVALSLAHSLAVMAGMGVAVGVFVCVGVELNVGVGVGVAVGVDVEVDVGIAVGVADGAIVREAVGTTATEVALGTVPQAARSRRPMQTANDLIRMECFMLPSFSGSCSAS
jgi:hypothetical protein